MMSVQRPKIPGFTGERSLVPIGQYHGEAPRAKLGNVEASLTAEEKHCYELIGVAVGLGAIGFWGAAFIFSAAAGAYCGEHHVFG